MTRRLFFIVLLVLSSGTPASAQRVEAQWGGGGKARWVSMTPGPLMSATWHADVRVPAARDADRERLESLLRWNGSGRVPIMNGFVREMTPIQVSLEGASSGVQTVGRAIRDDSGRIVWSADFEIEQGFGFRVRFDFIELPMDTEIWVSDGTFHSGPFTIASLAHESSLWTPSIRASRGRVLIALPPGVESGSFRVEAILELVDPYINAYTDCAINGECVGNGDFDGIEMARAAVALLEFVEGRSSYICTGGLLADTVSETTIPYLLTANHCFDSQAAASSLEAWFDYRWDDCAKSGLDPGDRAVGSTLLESRASSDFTLVRLTGSIPSGRAYLGWDADPTITGSTPLHRISHPAGDAQTYSRSFEDTLTETCFGYPRSRFIYAEMDDGATTGGSSGSPVLLDGAIVVGQLFGACASEGSDDCDYASYSEMDGRFSETFPWVEEWLDPPACEPAAISSQPSGRSIEYNESTTLVAEGEGSEPVGWQWYRGASGDTGDPIGGADERTYETPRLTETTSYWVRATNECGEDDSEASIVTVAECDAAGVSRQPSSAEIEYGERVTLRVEASGSADLRFQWYEGESGDTSKRISGATSRSYRTPELTESSSFWARATNDCGRADSRAALVTVRCDLPELEYDEEPVAVDRGGTVGLSVVANGTEPLAYQWFAGDDPIEDATGAQLSTPPVERTTVFRVVVTNPCGSAEAEFLVQVPLKRRRSARRP